MLRSYIVQRDPDTLIVSQHVPSDFDIDIYDKIMSQNNGKVLD